MVRASAEALPFADGTFDAAMAVLSDHHWGDRIAGLRELRRVARRAVVVQADPDVVAASWLVREYLPGFARLHALSLASVAEALGATRVEPLPVPWDCVDGFFVAHWRRPEAYLDPRVRAGTSVFARLLAGEVDAAAAALHLESGAWAARHAALLELEELDVGLRLLVA